MEFWETSFTEKQAMWGFEAAASTMTALQLFKQNQLNKILVPGFGYGRNAKVFADHGLEVTGIEISQAAIEIATKNYGNDLKYIMVRLARCSLIRNYTMESFATH